MKGFVLLKRHGVSGVLATLIGIILSGPVGIALVSLVAPQPVLDGANNI